MYKDSIPNANAISTLNTTRDLANKTNLPTKVIEVETKVPHVTDYKEPEP